MLVWSNVALAKVGDLHLVFYDITVSPSIAVCNLGVTFDLTLSFQTHINSLNKTAFFHLRNIAGSR